MQTGTVIHGTLRPEDLIPAFYRTLEEIAPVTAKIRREGTWAEEIEAALAGKLDEYREKHPEDGYEYIGSAIEALMDDLDEEAPTGYYFGTLEGDASDFGFWPNYDDDAGFDDFDKLY